MINIKKYKLFNNLFIILSFIIISVICSILLLHSNNVYGGYDTQFHFKRIMELIYSINNFKLLPNFSFNYFHGSAVMSLYPYINLFPAVLLSFFIKSKVMLVYGYFIINTFITFIISYFSSKDYIKSYSTSYMFAFIYGTSNIFLSYSFILTDYGITSTFMFLPIIIFGFLKLIQNKGWIQLSIGISLLSMSHILNLAIIIPFLLLWLMINLKKLNRHVFVNLLKSIILFFIISSVIWMPFLHFYIFNFQNLHMPYSIKLQRLSLSRFMSGIYGGKDSDTIGFFPIITLFMSIFFYKRFSNFVKQMYWLSLVIILCSLFLPWNLITSYGIFKSLGQLQGTFRFMIVPIILLTFIFALIISKYMNLYHYRILLFSSVILFSLLLQLIVGQYSFLKSKSNSLLMNDYLERHNNIIFFMDNPYYKFNSNYQFNLLMNSYQDTNNDYIPKMSVPLSSYVNRDLGFYNNKHKIKVNRVGYNTFHFSSRNYINKLSLPIYAYNREKLNVYLNDKPVNNYANNSGLLTMTNIQDNIKANNKVYIKPSPDPFRITGSILFVIGLLFTIFITIKRKFID